MTAITRKLTELDVDPHKSGVLTDAMRPKLRLRNAGRARRGALESRKVATVAICQRTEKERD